MIAWVSLTLAGCARFRPEPLAPTVNAAALDCRIGMAGGFGPYATGGASCAKLAVAPAFLDSADAAYAGGGMTGADYAASRR